MVRQQNIIFYSKHDCELCRHAKDILDILSKKYQVNYQEIDIYTDDYLLEKYQLMIPVIQINGEVVQAGKVSISKLDRLFNEMLFN